MTTVELTDEMQGRLSRAGWAAEDIGFVPPGRSWTGELGPAAIGSPPSARGATAGSTTR